MGKWIVVAGLVLVGVMIVRSNLREFKIRETRGGQPGAQRVVEIQGHGKKCYVYNSTRKDGGNSSVLLWCENEQ